MSKGTTPIRITKISAVESPEYPTPTIEDYDLGKINHNVSIPANYEVEGFLVGSIEIGKPVLVMRKVRNGIKMSGIFQTSEVISVTGKEFKTRNSVYKYKFLF